MVNKQQIATNTAQTAQTVKEERSIKIKIKTTTEDKNDSNRVPVRPVSICHRCR